MKKTLVALAVLFSVSLLAPSFANAWSNRGYFNLYVLGHRFHSVKVKSGTYRYGTQCQLFITVKFWAPTPVYHRFQARVTLGSGAWIRTPVFYNQGFGERRYTYTYDTGPQGCWATSYNRVTYLRVHGCSGYGCYLRPLY